jgi:[ribosomal protein S18]-alanine N-acetyltransferase
MGFFGKRKLIVEVRPLTPSDSHDCSAIHHACFAHSWSSIDFEMMIAGRDHVCDGAFNEQTGALLGFCVSRIAADEAEILTIAISKAFRAQGVATQLLESQKQALFQARIKKWSLEVEENNQAALRLYGRLGFQVAGTRAGYYAQNRTTPAHALVLTRAL